MIRDTQGSLQDIKEKLTDKTIKLQNLNMKLIYVNSLLLKSEILKMIDNVLNDGLNIAWNMVCKQNRKK